MDSSNGFSLEPNQETAGEATSSPKQLTDKDVSQIVNKAIGARFKDFEQKIQESLNQLVPKQEKQQLSEKDAFLLKLETKVKQLEEKNKASRQSHLDAVLEKELLANNFAPQAIKALKAQLKAENTISYASDESEDIVWRNQDECFSLQEGLKNFAQTEEAKFFQPPKQVKGSGDSSYVSNKNFSTNSNPSDSVDQFYKFISE